MVPMLPRGPIKLEKLKCEMLKGEQTPTGNANISLNIYGVSERWRIKLLKVKARLKVQRGHVQGEAQAFRGQLQLKVLNQHLWLGSTTRT